MLLLILFFIVGLVLLVTGIIIRHDDWGNTWEPWIIFGIIVLCVALIIGAFAWYDNAYCEMHMAQMREKYNIIVMQLEEHFYDRWTYDGRKELIKDVISYNNGVIAGRAKHGSKWIGVFYPEDWDSLPIIDISKLEAEHDRTD